MLNLLDFHKPKQDPGDELFQEALNSNFRSMKLRKIEKHRQIN